MEKASEISLSQRLYLIQNDVYHYHAGRLDDGNQVLMDEVYRVQFDTGGNFLAALSGQISELPPQIKRFTPGTISVRAFFLPELWLGIQDLPDHYQDFLDHPENSNEDERQYYPKEIEEWRDSGSFVLLWNEDYYLNADGELESS